MAKYKCTKSFEEVFVEIFNEKDKINEYIKFSFNEYIEDGDFDVFYRSLELAIKAQDSMTGFARKVDLSKMGLYNIVKGKKEPKISTLIRILKELGFTLELKVA